MDMDKNEQNLNLLSVFHYIAGALTALFACFPVIHIAIGIAILCGAMDGQGSGSPPPHFIGWIFVIFPAIFMVFGWALAIAMIIAGVKLKRRRSRTFCIVIAAAECLIMPFGTILGVFTLVMLMKDPVKELFVEDKK